MQKNKGQSSWISLSDLMTGLMLVFLLIVVMMQENTQKTLVRYENTKREIHDALQKKFAHELQSDKVKISQDLVVRFQETEALFEQDQATLSPYYKKVLDDFIPKYLTVLQDERFRENIQEVRIEGHTGNVSQRHPEYTDLVALSQKRARAILRYFVSSGAFKDLPKRDKQFLRFKLMANGFGNGRMVDEEGKYVLNSSKLPQNTRRVEFRIMTDAEQKLEEALRQL